MKFLHLLTIFAVVVLSLKDVDANSKYRKLVRKLKSRLDADYVPFGPNTEAVNVSMSVDLLDIREASAHKNEMEISVILSIGWNAGVSWDEQKYKFDQVRIQASDIWTPDLTSYNGFRKFENQAPSIVVLYKSGSATWVPRGRLDAKCDISPKRLEINETCVFKIGSWTNSAKQLRLKEPSGEVAVDDFNSAKYQILDAKLTKETKVYSCCPEEYENYALTISFARKNRKDAPSGE